MAGLSPFVQNVNFTNDRGENLWNSGSMPTGQGIQQVLNQGSGIAQNAIMQRAQQMIASGQAPTTPAEAAAMESIYQQQAGQQEQANLQAQMAILTGQGAAEGGRGFMGMNGLPASFRPNPPPGAGQVNGGSAFSHPQGGTAWAVSQQAQQNGPPADGVHDNANQPGHLTAGGSSTGATGGGFPANQGLHGEATGALMRLLQNPGMDQRTVQQMVSRGADGLSEAEKSARLEMRANAVSRGGGEGNDLNTAEQALQSQYAGMKAGQQRDITITAEQDRLNRTGQTLNTAFSFLGSVEDRAAADARFQQQMNRDDRNAMMQLLANNRPAVPDYSALTALAGQGANRFTMPFGGGANQGAGPGSATGAPQKPTAGGANQGVGPGSATMAPTPAPATAGAEAPVKPGYENTGGSFSPSANNGQGGAYKPVATAASGTASTGGVPTDTASYFSGFAPGRGVAAKRPARRGLAAYSGGGGGY